VWRAPEVHRIVVEHRDRLARFGFASVEAALAASGKQLVVVEGKVVDDLVWDLLEILTSAVSSGRPAGVSPVAPGASWSVVGRVPQSRKGSRKRTPPAWRPVGPSSESTWLTPCSRAIAHTIASQKLKWWRSTPSSAVSTVVGDGTRIGQLRRKPSTIVRHCAGRIP
jgi:hypothetical protein